MLDNGELSLEETRDRVVEVLEAVGTVKTDSSVWVNS